MNSPSQRPNTMKCQSSGATEHHDIAVLQFGAHGWIGATLTANLEGDR